MSQPVPQGCGQRPGRQTGCRGFARGTAIERITAGIQLVIGCSRINRRTVSFSGGASFCKVTPLNPKFATAYYKRGLSQDALGQNEAAIQDCDEAIRMNTEDADAFHLRGATKSQLGQDEAAIQDYDEAVRLHPEHADAFNYRGVSKSKLGQQEAAIQDYDEAIRLNPEYAESFDNRVVSKGKLGHETPQFPEPLF
ncbi:unnamed protein product [Symbiodinium sp. CCMP2592]|nr:unnamed protein product [Symbiodinium sp. CCMP2592]